MPHEQCKDKRAFAEYKDFTSHTKKNLPLLFGCYKAIVSNSHPLLIYPRNPADSVALLAIPILLNASQHFHFFAKPQHCHRISTPIHHAAQLPPYFSPLRDRRLHPPSQKAPPKMLAMLPRVLQPHWPRRETRCATLQTCSRKSMPRALAGAGYRMSSLWEGKRPEGAAGKEGYACWTG